MGEPSHGCHPMGARPHGRTRPVGTVHQATIDLCDWLRRVLKPLRLGRQTVGCDSQELTLEASAIGEPANERPVVSTFAAQLPFPLRLESGSVFTYELAFTYADPERAA